MKRLRTFSSLLSASVIVKGQATEDDWHSPARQQEQAAAIFPELVVEHGLRLAEPNSLHSGNGTDVVLGIGTWSVPELYLIDALSIAVQTNPRLRQEISVFDVRGLSLEELQAFVPRLEPIQTPILGIWRESRFVDAFQGFKARQWIIDYFKLEAILEGLMRQEESISQQVEDLGRRNVTGFVSRS